MDSTTNNRITPLEAISDALHREYLWKRAVFVVLVVITLFLCVQHGFAHIGIGGFLMSILVFTVAADLLGIRRCQRICHAIKDRDHATG